MSDIRFAVIAEKIHCTRIFKRNGKFVKTLDDGMDVVVYKVGNEERYLPIPEVFKTRADWEKGSIKHCAAAMWQGVYGDEAGRAAGEDYIRQLAISQAEAGGTFLDVNVDEFSTDDEERVRLMRWAIDIAQQATQLPISVDSSNTAILKAGLAACDRSLGKPMINSVSLEREEAIDLAGETQAVVVASAAGRDRLPTDTPERLSNLGELIPRLKAVGLSDDDIHIDPLVFPISTDSNNGKAFLDAVATIRKDYGPDVHITGGFSNVSFGMPNRKLINHVFTLLAVEAGADSGIVDPAHINGEILAATDKSTEAFELGRALLTGEDEFGMNFITAVREGRI